MAENLKTTLYAKDAKAIKEITVPTELFGHRWNADLVHQVITSLQLNAREVIAHTKTRGDVSGGGKKPWRQKGTGRARHGSIRSPLWKGGGVTHGPRNDRNFARKVNQKMKQKALWTILSAKYRDGETIFVDELSFAKPSTKDAQKVLNSFAKIKEFKQCNYKKGNRALFLVPEHSGAFAKSVRNIPSAAVEEVRSIDPVRALSYKYLIFVNPEKSIAQLDARRA